MKYQRNIALKLREMGFEFSSSIEQPENKAKHESALHYEVWRKQLGTISIDITIDHTSKKIVIILEPEDYAELSGLNSINDLILLERLVCGKKKNYINNEEGD